MILINSYRPHILYFSGSIDLPDCRVDFQFLSTTYCVKLVGMVPAKHRSTVTDDSFEQQLLLNANSYVALK